MDKNKKEILNKEINKQSILELLENLGYEYISPKNIEKYRNKIGNPILTAILRERLMDINSYNYKGKVYKFPESIIDEAIEYLENITGNGNLSNSEKIYDLLILGKSYRVFIEDEKVYKSFTFKYIDWNNIDNNKFTVIDNFLVIKDKILNNEVFANLETVLFINGIPVSIIEINENIDLLINKFGKSKRNVELNNLFKYIQIIMISNGEEARYGTFQTPKEYWNIWREEDLDWQEEILNKFIKDRSIAKLDRDIVSIFSKERLFELINNFILHELNFKKISRSIQYFAIKSALNKLANTEDKKSSNTGLIYHPKGSGVGFTISILTKNLLRKYKKTNAKIILISNNTNIDKAFANSNLILENANSIKDLIKLIEEDFTDIIKISKNISIRNTDVNKLIKSKNIFIIIDQDNIDNYSSIYEKIIEVIPNAYFIGFIENNYFKKDEYKIIESEYTIHNYFLEDAVKDKVVQLVYYHKINIEKDLNRTRIIAEKTLKDYRRRIGHRSFNAVFIVGSKAGALHYYRIFNKINDDENLNLNIKLLLEKSISKDRIESKYKPLIKPNEKNILDRKVFYNKVDTSKENPLNRKVDIYILNEISDINQEDKTQIIYMDKFLNDEEMVQAINQANTLDEYKKQGFIIDYRGVFENPDINIDNKIYKRDFKDLLIDTDSLIIKLKEDYLKLMDLLKYIEKKKESNDYNISIESKSIINTFNLLYYSFKENLDILRTMESSLNIKDKDELKKHQNYNLLFSKIQRNIKTKDLDIFEKTVDILEEYNKTKELNIRMKKYVREILKENSKNNTKSEEIDEIDYPNSYFIKAEKMRNEIKSMIDKNYKSDPYFNKIFLNNIDETLDKYKNKEITKKEYYEKIRNLYIISINSIEKIVKYPKNILKNGNARAIYGVLMDNIINDKLKENPNYLDNLENEEKYVKLTLKLEEAIRQEIKVDWHKNIDVNNKIAQNIDDIFFDFYEEIGEKLDIEKLDQMIEEILSIANERY